MYCCIFLKAGREKGYDQTKEEEYVLQCLELKFWTISIRWEKEFGHKGDIRTCKYFSAKQKIQLLNQEIKDRLLYDF